MGCDIHIVLEKKVHETEWLGLYCTDDLPSRRPVFAQRNYDFFAALANVRGRGDNYPRGLPSDISRLAWLKFSECPTDNHSSSNMALSEFIEIWKTSIFEKEPFYSDELGIRANYIEYDLFQLHAEPDDQYRVVFWFDN
ncbi:MAG: hypothetical protein DHS20C08_04260 [Rhodomicrobium sp.]|nr:MAG: hypothetical protein DHS20C08_04260 [Rhodomicrobium sp.]